jgi:hypothetical protein
MYPSSDTELARFQIKVFNARQTNKLLCIKYQEDIRGLFVMTPQEELYVHLFNREGPFVAAMDDAALEIHGQELARIAFEARICLTITEDEKNKRRNKKIGSSGFSSIIEGEPAKSAIEAIHNRNKKLNKMDKIKEGLIKMGMSQEEADNMVRASNTPTKPINIATASVNHFFDLPDRSSEEIPVKPAAKPFINPFTKK